jgi:peptidoglycan hydrolase-like protein with peptidoglycan-binding domain
MNGREFLKGLCERPTATRDDAIGEAICDGHARPLRMRPILLEARGRTCVVEVATRPVMLGAVDPVLVMVRHTTAIRIADHYNMVLGTARLSDAVWLGADVQLPVFRQTPDSKMAYTSRMIRHSDDVLRALGSASATEIAAPMGKDWHATNRLHGRPDRSAEYGAQEAGAPHQGVTPGVRVWQPAPGTGHVAGYSDYLTGCVRLYSREVLLDDGTTVDIEELARDPELCWLISSEGVLVDGLRHPAVPRPGDTVPDAVGRDTVRPPMPVFSRTIRHGSVGDDVAAWQRIIGAADDGVFGPLTESKTRTWQSSRGLVADGIVGPRTRGVALKEVDAGHHVEPPDGTVLGEYDVEALPFQQAKNFTWADRTVVHWIVIHSMEWAEKPNTAEACANMFAGRWGEAPESSAHVCFDCDSAVLCVAEQHLAWHAKKANRFGIGYELAGFHRQSRAEWLDDYSESMLWLSAKYAARVTVPKWNTPIQFVDRDKLRKAYADYIDHGLPVPDELRGFTTHVAVTHGLGGSHVDPGKYFPMDRYLQMVRDAAEG